MTPIPPIQHTPRPCFALRHPIAARRVRRSLKAVAILGSVLATCSVIALVCSLWVSIRAPLFPFSLSQLSPASKAILINRGNFSVVHTPDLLPISSEAAVGMDLLPQFYLEQQHHFRLHDASRPLTPHYQLRPYSDSIYPPPPPIIPLTLWHDYARTVIALWLPSTLGIALTLPHRFWRIRLTPHPAICSNCAYDLKGLLTNALCPECGTSPIASERTNAASAALTNAQKHNGPSSRQGR